MSKVSQEYEHLVERLNRFPQGVPPADELYEILAILFSEEEAELVAQLPIKPFTAEKASRIWKMDLASTRKRLDELCSRVLLVDVEREDGETSYVLPPPMAGFFEFSMMRLRDDVDQKLLGELFYQYCTVDEPFIKSLLIDGETQLGRVYVHEPVLPPSVHVLGYERASEIIKNASHRAISTCYCRFKMAQVGRDCDAPKDICMTFNNSAAALARHGFAREVDVAECLDLLQVAYDYNLVQFGENAREGVNFICNCCSCCCEALVGARRFANMRPIHTTNFLPSVDETACTGCGQCVTVCPIEALSLVSAHDPQRPKRKQAKVDETLCLGCGVCARVCPTHSITLQARPERVITPYNSVHRVVLMALERGKLQNLIFDNQVLWSHRALAAVLGVILKLPPVKQIMATEQVRSRYLEALVRRLNY